MEASRQPRRRSSDVWYAPTAERIIVFLLAIAITVGLVNTFHNSGLIHSFCDKLHPYLVQYRVRGQNVKDVDTTQMKVFRDFIRSAPTQKAQHDLVRGIVTYRNDKSQIQIIPIINCDNL